MKKAIKKMISVLLAITLLIGMVSGIGKLEVKAADPIPFTLSYVLTDTAVYMKSSIAADSGAVGSGMFYVVSAYLDGNSEAQDVVMDATAWWSGTYPEADTAFWWVADHTSIRIVANTVFQQCDGNGVSVEGGKQLKLEEEFYIVKNEDGTWSQMENTALTFEKSEVDVNNGNVTLYFTSSLPSGMLGTYYQFEAYFNGSTATETAWIDASSYLEGQLAVWNNAAYASGGGLKNVTSMVIPEGTSFKELDSSLQLKDNGKEWKLSEKCELVKSEDGTWTQKKMPGAALTFKNPEVTTEGNVNLYFTSSLPSEMMGPYYQFTAYFNGSTTLETAWIETSAWLGGQLAIWNGAAYGGGGLRNVTSMVIPEGTIFKELDSSLQLVGGGKEWKLTKELNLVKISQDNWIDITMLDVKVQDNYEAVPTGTSKFDMRFIGSVNCLDYKSAGFVFSTANSTPTLNGDNCVTKTTTKVYKSVNASGSTLSVENIYGDYSKYMYAFEIKNTPADTTIYVRAYVELDDGSIQYGKVREVKAPSQKQGE